MRCLPLTVLVGLQIIPAENPVECFERYRIQIVRNRYIDTMADSLIRFDPLSADVDGRGGRDETTPRDRIQKLQPVF